MALPKDVTIPSSSQFMKFKEGQNKFRILSDVTTGWEGWKDKKPFRHEGDTCKIKPEQVDTNKFGNPAISYFWAMAVYNYQEKKVQVLEITQKSIMEQLYSYEQNDEWGDLKNYDVSVNRKEESNKTKYTVQAIPPKPLATDIAQAYKESDVDIKKLFDGEYPMPIETDSDESLSDIPF